MRSPGTEEERILSPARPDANGVVIGQDQDVLNGGFEANQNLAGCMDDLRIFNCVLGDSEVRTLCEAEAPRRLVGPHADTRAKLPKGVRCAASLPVSIPVEGLRLYGAVPARWKGLEEKHRPHPSTGLGTGPPAPLWRPAEGR